MRIEQTQGTESWHEYRKGGIGSSDIAAIMGLCPWRSAYDVWLEKTGRKEGFSGNEATRRGQALEKEARLHYNMLYSANMQPACYQHDDLPFLRSSLDGIDLDAGVVLEIKCPGIKNHESVVRNNVVPDHYIPQIQFHLLCTGIQTCDWMTYHPNSEVPSVVINVEQDLEFQKQIVEEAGAFWKLVQDDIAPESSESSYVFIDNKEFKDAAEAYKAAKALHDHSKQVLETSRKSLLEYTDDGNCKGGGLRLTKVIKKGNIDWESVKKEFGLKDQDLEAFRKKETQYWAIKEIKDDSN